MLRFGIFTLLASVAVAAPSLTKRDGPIGQVQLISFSYTGKGCNAGRSTRAVLTPDPTALTLTYNGLVAQAGPDTPSGADHITCLVGLTLQIPQGWQFSIVKVDYHGIAKLPTGVTGTCQALYFFSGNSQQTTSSVSIRGPFDDDLVKTDALSAGSTTWSPCGNKIVLNIAATNKISPPNPNQLAVIAVGSNRPNRFYLQWRTCTI
ncbi:hypothetical protein C8A05DRAFT_47613 [Staphylotrichum tortipilum]|uniref:Secreted protein n=1 Tax=Staphylotrichum tortipilum TaxID=2831512 RepID=A0AAN6MBV6_9PEZI|nr:hypothetical protein C8A05DRAFT_47613 [Staphylotrichum longicolle]